MASKSKGKMPARNKKNFRPTKKGAGMTKAGVAAYRRKNPGSKLQTAVTGKVKNPVAKQLRGESHGLCCRSAGQMKKFQKQQKIQIAVQDRLGRDGYVNGYRPITKMSRQVSKPPKKGKKMPKDACYRKVKARYKVSSAYASGAIAKCRKKRC